MLVYNEFKAFHQFTVFRIFEYVDLSLYNVLRNVFSVFFDMLNGVLDKMRS